MTVAPLIAMKSTKCESLEAVGKELDRRAHTYANDVDQSGRHVGYLCRAGDESPVPLEQAIERRMGELNTKRKIRDNQVRAMGFIVSSNDALDEKGAREKLKEMNQLEKEMDEWSPFDDVEEGRAASKRLELERSGFAPDRNYDGQAL